MEDESIECEVGHQPDVSTHPRLAARRPPRPFFHHESWELIISTPIAKCPLLRHISSMSGFEVVGVVLGVIPLVISGLEHVSGVQFLKGRARIE